MTLIFKRKYTSKKSEDATKKDYNALTTSIEIEIKKNLSKNDLRVLNVITHYSNIYPFLWLSQGKIAKLCNLASKTVYRIIKKLTDLEIISKKNRIMRTCRYYLHKIFFNYGFRNRLKKLIPSLAWLPAMLLTFAGVHINATKNNCQRETVQLFIKDKSVINNTPLQGIYNNNSLSTNTVVNKFTGSNSEVENLGNGVCGENNYKVMVNNDTKLDKKNAVCLQRVDYRHENTIPSAMVKTVYKESNLNLQNCITDIKSSVLLSIAKELNLGNYEVSQLSVFSDVVLKKSYKVLCDTVNVKNPYRFLLGVCKKIEERMTSNQSVSTVVKVAQDPEKVISKPQEWVRPDYMNKKVRKLTDIANDIAKLEEQIKNADQFPAFLRQEFVNGLEVTIKLLIEEEYQKEESESDYIALQYIDKFRIQYDLTPRFYTGREFTIKENVQQNNMSENSNSFAIDDTW